MSGILFAAALVLSADLPRPATDTWTAAYQRGDYSAAAVMLQRAVFEVPRGTRPDAAALKQLGLLYADGKGVERDPIMACGMLRAHAIAASSAARATAAAKKAAQSLVERYCTPLSVTDRAAAFAAMACPRIGLQRGATVPLESGWSIQFNDRSATVTRNGQTREHPLAGDLLCRSQVMLMRHSALDPLGERAREARHVIELITLQSGWHAGALTREIVWQLYEVRGLDLDLAAVQRWQQQGSAWPAPPLPAPLVHGVSFTVQHSGDLEYDIDDTPPRHGRVDVAATATTTRR
jgi:hypothetical protein